MTVHFKSFLRFDLCRNQHKWKFTVVVNFYKRLFFNNVGLNMLGVSTEVQRKYRKLMETSKNIFCGKFCWE